MWIELVTFMDRTALELRRVSSVCRVGVRGRRPKGGFDSAEGDVEQATVSDLVTSATIR